jgi:hypothetical protein
MNTSTVTLRGKPSHGNARRSSPLVDERVTHAAHCPPTPPSPDDYSLHDLDAAESAMQAVLDAYPALTPSGFTVSPRPIAIPRSIEWVGPAAAVISRESELFAFWQDRMAMRTEEALAALLACRGWPRITTVKQKALNKQLDSEKIRNIAGRRSARWTTA